MKVGEGSLLLSGAAIVGVLGLAAIFAPLLAPYDPHALSGPALAAPSAHHLLGTNDVGQDILSQLIWGTRSSAVVALLAAAIAIVLGITFGIGAGLLGGWVDVVVMRIVDGILAIPALPVLILIAALVGPSRLTTTIVIGLVGWPPVARVLRADTLSLRRSGFVESARGFGGSTGYIVRRHLVPELAPVIAANFVYWASTGVVLQAGLAFLGLADPTEVTWGGMLNRALSHEGIYFTSEWMWWVLPAGLVIALAVLGLALLGLALEPTANPRMRRV